MPLPSHKYGILFAAAILTGSVSTILASPPEPQNDLTAAPAESVSTAFGGSPASGKEVVSGKEIITPAPTNLFCLFGGTLCFDAEERLRFETLDNNYDFNSKVKSPTDGSWLQNRFRLGALWKPTSWLQFYVQGEDSREWFSNRPKIPGDMGAEGDDTFDLHQAYVQIGNSDEFPLVLKAGRQVLAFGDERLVGGFDWNTFGRVFDAVKLTWKEPTWQLDAFVSSVVVINKDEFDESDVFDGNDNDRQQYVFSGLYFSDTGMPWGTLELYALWLSEANGTVSNQEFSVSPTRPTTGLVSKPSSFGTYGGHLKGDPKKLHGWEFDIEGAYQNGNLEGQQLDAFAAHAGIGYNFDVALQPRIWAEYNYASGDKNPNDNRSETFQNLFPTNHPYYGNMDLFSWQNMQNAMVGLRIAPMKKVTAELDFNAFWLASTNDTWYRANGLTAVRALTPAAENANDFVGTELDFILTWKVNDHLSFQGGYSHFFTGAYVAETGPSDAANFGYLQATLKF